MQSIQYKKIISLTCYFQKRAHLAGLVALIAGFTPVDAADVNIERSRWNISKFTRPKGSTLSQAGWKPQFQCLIRRFLQLFPPAIRSTSIGCLAIHPCSSFSSANMARF
jgi:hypothetical protein